MPGQTTVQPGIRGSDLDVHVSDKVHVHAQFGEQRGLGDQRLVCGLGVRCVDDLCVVGLVSRHVLVTAHSAQNDVGDRPLRVRRLLATLGLFSGQATTLARPMSRFNCPSAM